MTEARVETERDARVRNGVLAAALLALELVAGMQSYLLSTIIPIVAADLDAHAYYGVITATAQVAMFVTMPLGPYLLQRFRVDRLLLHLTWVSVAGGAVSAIAPSVEVFLAGRAASGLASGALATVSLAAIVTVLPPAWRRAVLAGYSAMWVVTSLVGPAYAGWVASALSWRWALVLYLPLLLIARLVIAKQLNGTMQAKGDQERLTIGVALVLAGGVALLSVIGFPQVPLGLAAALALVGMITTVAATRRLLPAGTLRARSGRPAAIATMGVLTGSYFGASSIIAIIVHDLLDGTAAEVAIVLASGGLGWAITGLAVSRWPARTVGAFARRGTLGAALIASGLVATGWGTLDDGLSIRLALVLVGWTVAGVGMGLVYLDTLNQIVEVPVQADGVSVPRAAAAAILAEAIATAITTTIAAALVGRAVAGGDEVADSGAQTAAIVLGAAVILAVLIMATARRVSPTQPSSAASSRSRSDISTSSER